MVWLCFNDCGPKEAGAGPAEAAAAAAAAEAAAAATGGADRWREFQRRLRGAAAGASDDESEEEDVSPGPEPQRRARSRGRSRGHSRGRYQGRARSHSMGRRGSRAGSRDAAAGASDDDGARRLPGGLQHLRPDQLDELRTVVRASAQQVHVKDQLRRRPPDGDPLRPFDAPGDGLRDRDRGAMHARRRLYEELMDYCDPIPSPEQAVGGIPHKNRDRDPNDLLEPVQANPGADIMEFIKSRVT